METKINYNNIQSEEIGKIADRLMELEKDSGDVLVWTENEKAVTKQKNFSSEENAKQYGALRNEFYMRRGIVERDKPVAYIIGSEKDYQKAKKAWCRREKAGEVKRYAEHVEKLVERSRAEIKALEALKDVCRTFDGKVINKRFLDAAKEATGFCCSFYDGCLGLSVINSYGEYAPCITFYGSWKAQKDKEWEWFTGDRMEAEKALGLIDWYILDIEQQIAKYKDSVKHYAKYLAKARKVELLIKELGHEDTTIRAWAREHDLKKYLLFSSIWVH